jgi:hypothetical protein
VALQVCVVLDVGALRQQHARGRDEVPTPVQSSHMLRVVRTLPRTDCFRICHKRQAVDDTADPAKNLRVSNRQMLAQLLDVFVRLQQLLGHSSTASGGSVVTVILTTLTVTLLSDLAVIAGVGLMAPTCLRLPMMMPCRARRVKGSCSAFQTPSWSFYCDTSPYVVRNVVPGMNVVGYLLIDQSASPLSEE